jgi:hypothetical protein
MTVNIKRPNLVILLLVPAITTLFFAIPLLLDAGPLSYLAFAVVGTQQPDVNATHVYQAHTMILGNNVKNLVITIPNEAHEQPGGLPRDLRVANQPYFPQNAVVNVGTTAVWFNNDVGHLHKITLIDNKNPKIVLYDSGTFPNFIASKPIKFNNTGTFAFSEAHTNPKQPNFVMNGMLTVVNQPNAISSTNQTSSATGANVDTLIPFMVPATQQDKFISAFKAQGFGVGSTYTFKSTRGGGTEGCGGTASLLVLTSSGKTLDQVISALKQIAPMTSCT